MSAWAESLGVLLISAGGVPIGAWLSRLPRQWWLLGYFLPLSVIVVFAIALHEPGLSFIPPISWLILGRTKFVASGFVGSLLFTTLLLKLHNRREQIALGLLTSCIVLAISVWPFLAPAFNRELLASLKTRMDADGVCLQNTAYTCGPASAVTALRKLGFSADEGPIAILAHTSSAIGTPPDVLAAALQKEYESRGLVSEFRAFKNLAELRSAGLTCAVIKFNPLLDHYVTVLEVTDHDVIVGDPLNGLTKLSHADFLQKWRYVGVVLRRK